MNGQAGQAARDDWKLYMQKYNTTRRDALRAKGLCVDCGNNPVSKKPGRIIRGMQRPRTLCDTCTDARKTREHVRRSPFGGRIC